MITKERYDLLVKWLEAGADLSPVDLDNMAQYEAAMKGPPCSGMDTCAEWRKDSSLERWFPITAEEVARLSVDLEQARKWNVALQRLVEKHGGRIAAQQEVLGECREALEDLISAISGMAVSYDNLCQATLDEAANRAKEILAAIAKPPHHRLMNGNRERI